MKKQIIRTTIFGIAWGCTFFVFLGIITTLILGKEGSLTGQEYINSAIGSMIIGLGFSVPSIVYGFDKISRGIKVLIHMGTGLAINFCVAFSLGWIPTNYGVAGILTNVALFILIAFAIWGVFYLYYRYEAYVINKSIREKHQ